MSFAEDKELEVEIPILAPKDGMEGQLHPPRHPEDVARANLSRLVANHRRMAKRWSFLEDLQEKLRLSVQSICWFIAGRHAAVSGDVLLLGRHKGQLDSAVRLAGAQVTVLGSTVMVRPKEQPHSIALRLESPAEADQWANSCRSAGMLSEPHLDMVQLATSSQIVWTKLIAWEAGTLLGRAGKCRRFQRQCSRTGGCTATAYSSLKVMACSG